MLRENFTNIRIMLIYGKIVLHLSTIPRNVSLKIWYVCINVIAVNEPSNDDYLIVHHQEIML